MEVATLMKYNVLIFFLLQKAEYTIVVEEDLDVAPDFFR